MGITALLATPDPAPVQCKRIDSCSALDPMKLPNSFQSRLLVVVLQILFTSATIFWDCFLNWYNNTVTSVNHRHPYLTTSEFFGIYWPDGMFVVFLSSIILSGKIICYTFHCFPDWLTNLFFFLF